MATSHYGVRRAFALATLRARYNCQNNTRKAWRDAGIVDTFSRGAVMGLLSECKFCHQFFSSAGMADHVRSKHGALIRAKAVLSQFRVQLIAAPAARQQILQPAQTRAPSERPYIRRLSKAEQAQKVRSELQARKNEATAAFIRKSVQQKANVEPLKSVWKEQVAKLSPLKGIQAVNEGEAP